MIKNVIFDLGNVLLEFNPQEYLRTKIADENKVQELYRGIFLSEEWEMLDRGVITQEKAIHRMVARSAANGELILFCMQNWYELLTPIEETVAILKEVKARGYKTFILSNFHLLAYKDITARYGFLQNFDGGVISCQEKLIKPELAIYHKLMTQYALSPGESIFIDDSKENIAGAEKAGINSILFLNPAGLHKKLVEWKVLEDR